MKDGVKGLRMNSVKPFHRELQTTASAESPVTEAHWNVQLLPSQKHPPRLTQQPREIDERNEENKA